MNRFPTVPARVPGVDLLRSVPDEGRVVCIRSGLVSLVVCLSLSGCSLFGKKPNAPVAQNPADPPPPSFSAPSRDLPPANPVSAANEGGGVFAGQVVDRYNRRPSGVLIRVLDLEDTREPKAAPIEKQADEQGYFTISGLRPGGHYELIARVQDGDRVFTGTLFAKPPNPRLIIWMSDELSGADASAPPRQPNNPGKPDAAPRPAATLDSPGKETVAPTPPPPAPPGAANPSAPATNAAPATPPARTNAVVDPERTASGPNDLPAKDGFFRTPSKPEPVSVPSQTLPPPPGFRPTEPASPAEQARPQPQQLSQAAPATQASAVLAENPPVPSCQLIGRKLVNLSLYDHNGNVWEYRKDRSGRDRIGRLVLLDFWSSHCIPCLAAMPELVELNHTYGPYGLDVVGIAYETGTHAQQVAQILSVRGRYGVRYPTLLGAGANCPVRTQFDIDKFPTIILLDENGEIVLRKEGLTSRDLQELKYEIHRRLVSSR